MPEFFRPRPTGAILSHTVENDSQIHNHLNATPLDPMSLTATGHPTLASLPKGACGLVVEHVTDPGTAERLSALGLGLGARFCVVRSGKRMVVRVGESRIGLGPDLSSAVRAIVRPSDPR